MASSWATLVHNLDSLNLSLLLHIDIVSLFLQILFEWIDYNYLFFCLKDSGFQPVGR